MNFKRFWNEFFAAEEDYRALHEMPAHALAEEITRRFGNLDPADSKDRLLIVLAERLKVRVPQEFPRLHNRTLKNLLDEVEADAKHERSSLQSGPR